MRLYISFKILLLFFIPLAISCNVKNEEGKTISGLNPACFTTVVDGDSVKLVILKNKKGMELCISNYGARIVSLMVPDKEGKSRNVVLGFDSIQAYFPEVKLAKMGGTIGRYANRIGHSRFILDGDTINVTENNFGHSLHGGAEDGDRGWQYKVFTIREQNDSTVLLSLVAPDGENGFPGNVTATVRFTLSSRNAVRIDYMAETDKATVVCMSNQSYFNLSGDPDSSISDLRLQINATCYLPVDSTRLVTGEIARVEGTPMDFRKEKLIGRDIDNAWYEQIRFGNGYDHPFVLDTKGNLNEVAAKLHCKRSGIIMEIYTTEPSIQLYTGNFLSNSLSRKQEGVFSQRHGLSLEPQHFPDSPNHPEWPSAVLRPGENFGSTSIYKFRTED